MNQQQNLNRLTYKEFCGIIVEYMVKECEVCTSKYKVKPSIQHKRFTCSKKCGYSGDCWKQYLSNNNVGKNHPNYISDRTKLKKSEKKHLDGRYKEWMFAVKNRDNCMCRFSDYYCKGRLEAHHILNWMDYPELRYRVNNGITLCLAHHPRGRANEESMVEICQHVVSEISK